MKDLIEQIGLSPIIKKALKEFKSDDFEEVYCQISELDDEELLRNIEGTIDAYFSKLKLPQEITLYDQLVLSLRGKDIIATFNWDPLLFLALQRNHLKGDMPKAAFLHGNVAIGCCHEDYLLAVRGAKCPKCGNPLCDTKLLYPIREKDYSQDHFIRNEWKKLERRIEHAFIVTIFGYSAPSADVDAIKLMEMAWSKNNAKNYGQIEIIDIENEDLVRRKWDPFIVDTHYDVRRDFQDSFIARYPRRSCEAMWAQVMECKYLEERALPRNPSWKELHTCIDPRIAVEKAQSDR